MILNEEKEGWHYVVFMKLSTLLSGHQNIIVIFFVWIVFILLEQKISLSGMKKVCKNKDLYGIIMSSKKDKILEFN